MTDVAIQVRKRLDAWKERLLDTSRRNRLLYFRPSPTSAVGLVEPTFESLWNRLVIAEKPFTFYQPDVDRSFFTTDENTDEEEEDRPKPTPSPLRADQIRGDLEGKRLARTLYALRQKARLSLEECGICTLFVGFGLLHWSDGTEEESAVSPLLLAPVELVWESALSPFKLRPFDEDVVVNPALAFKLQTSCRVTLPELPEDPKLRDYLRAVEGAITGRKSWRVFPAAYLSLFSFHKLSMYHDLGANAERARSHPLVAALAGVSAMMPAPAADLANSDLDQIAPDETFQVLDADSSQQEAILAAKRGESFVLQGPPGTGKSQTIANIITECLADGKRVLFVSEKMAALEVVFRRLTEAGVGDSCLQLHSQKANKKEVIEDLGRTYNAPRNDLGSDGRLLAELERTRSQLNEYVSALHRQRLPLGFSIFEAHGRLAALSDSLDLDFQFDDAERTTEDQLASIDSVLDELKRLHPVLMEVDSHPWREVGVKQFTLQLQSELRTRLGHLLSLLAALQESTGMLAHICGLKAPDSLQDVDWLISAAELLVASPRPPECWLSSKQLKPLIDAAQRHREEFDRYSQRRTQLLNRYSEALFALDHQGLSACIATVSQPVIQQMTPTAGARHDRLRLVGDELAHQLKRSAELIGSIGAAAEHLSGASGLADLTTLSPIEESATIIQLTLADPWPLPDWFTRTRLGSLRTTAEEAKERYRALIEARSSVFERYRSEFLSLDIPTLSARFEGPYAGVLRLFQPGYYRDRKVIRMALKYPGRVSCEEATRDLRLAGEVQHQAAWVEANRDTLLESFGRHFDDERTDWDRVLQSLDTCRQIVDRLGDGRVPAGLVETMVASGSKLETLRALLQAVIDPFNLLAKVMDEIQQVLTLHVLPFTPLPYRQASLSELRLWLSSLGTQTEEFVSACKAVEACSASESSPTVEGLLEDVTLASEVVATEREVAANASALEADYGYLFHGLQTQWQEVLDALDWTGKVLDAFGTRQISDAYWVRACGESMAEVLPALDSVRAQRRDVQADLAYLNELFPNRGFSVLGQSCEAALMSDFASWVHTHLERLPDLESWLALKAVLSRGQDARLAPFLGAVLQRRPPASELKSLFYKRFWTLWLDGA